MGLMWQSGMLDREEPIKVGYDKTSSQWKWSRNASMNFYSITPVFSFLLVRNHNKQKKRQVRKVWKNTNCCDNQPAHILHEIEYGRCHETAVSTVQMCFQILIFMNGDDWFEFMGNASLIWWRDTNSDFPSKHALQSFPIKNSNRLSFVEIGFYN